MPSVVFIAISAYFIFLDKFFSHAKVVGELAASGYLSANEGQISTLGAIIEPTIPTFSLLAPLASIYPKAGEWRSL